jgi:hypothetical protein
MIEIIHARPINAILSTKLLTSPSFAFEDQLNLGCVATGELGYTNRLAKIADQSCVTRNGGFYF